MNEKSDGPAFGRAIIGTLAFVAAVCVCWWWLAARSLRGGELGDSFGVVNTFFSGLAFGGVIIAVLLQRSELRLQRQELKHTREVMMRQQEALASQDATLKRQAFENTFFQLLRLQNESVGSMDLLERRPKVIRMAPAEEVITGRDCFKRFYEVLRVAYKNACEPTRGSHNLQPIELINAAYQEFFEKHQSDVGHYFRSLYHIIKFVDQSGMENKETYTALVRAQLSSYELLLLFYNSLSGKGREKFKPLIERYALLKTVPISGALLDDSHRQLYEPAAFASASA